jgi:RHS repeat-associated protein
MAYDAWGKRLNANGTTDPNGALNPASTDRGYTGHEHLDELGFVHMNGRIYDPLLGRFLSPDPHIQAEELLQNYNRYSYVLNNPLRYTDPSGEFWQIPVFIIGMALAASNNKDLKLIGSMMMMAAMMVGTGTEQGLLVQALGKPGAAFVAATVSTSISTGSLSQGLKSGAFAAAFSYVGGLENLELAEKVVAHAVLGCAQQAASGGQCGPGAAAAAFGKIVSNADVFKETSPSLTQAVATVVAGGTVSVIGGGKFANGAAQAAFGYLFNCVASGCQGKVATLAKALSNEQSAATLRFFNPTDPTPPTPDQISRDAKELSADYIVTATEIQQQGNILQPLTSGVPTTSTVGAAIKAARSFFGFGKVETWDWSSDVDQFSKQLSDRFGAAARNGPGLTFKTRYLELKNGQ